MILAVGRRIGEADSGSHWSGSRWIVWDRGWYANSQPGNRSDIAAFDLFAQGFDQLRHLVHVRIDRERPAEGIKRALVVAEILHDHAKTRQRAEMAEVAATYQHEISLR